MSAKKTLVVAPHPDDEVLGVGGTILRRKKEGNSVAWLVMTSISVEFGWDPAKVMQRSIEIQKIKTFFDFDEIYALNFPTTRLDNIPMSDLVASVADVFSTFSPEEIFVPHPADIHTDHRATFDSVMSCTKWFRYPSVKRVLAYETLSESDFSMSTSLSFRPNVYVNITPFLDRKLEAMKVYSSELGTFPFPRSPESIRALAQLRGSAAGFHAAEAFELLRELD